MTWRSKLALLNFILPDKAGLSSSEALAKANEELTKAQLYLRKAHNELDEKVKLRTAELTTANLTLEKEIESRKRIENDLTKKNQELGNLTQQLLVEAENRKSAERAHKRLTQQLAQSNRDLQQFAYIASHDLQEPLRMVISYTQLLEKRYHEQLDETAKTFMGHITGSAKRMHFLIQDLLAFCRIDSQGQNLVTINANYLLNDVLKDLHLTIQENGVSVSYGDLPEISVDRSQLRQVLQNLIGNSIKYRSKDPLKIHIQAEPLATTQIALPLEVNEQGWLFSLKDNGIGIDPKYSEKIFGVFERLHTHAEYPGTGIGLALCKRIIETHGGHIWVESELGKGSTFYFTVLDSLKNGQAASPQTTKTPETSA